MNFNILRQLLTTAVIILLTACAGPKNITLTSEASTNLNLDIQGKPLSVVVQVYQLKSDKSFKLLTPDLLAGSKPIPDMLGSDLLANKELVFLPGSKQKLDITILQEANYVGVIAYFRQPNPYYWRLLYDAGRVRSKDLTLKLTDCYLQAVKPDAIVLPDQSTAMKPNCQKN